MLQNAKVVVFTVSELFRENRQEGGGINSTPLPPPRVELNEIVIDDLFLLLVY